jgi:hypothetical protein
MHPFTEQKITVPLNDFTEQNITAHIVLTVNKEQSQGTP